MAACPWLLYGSDHIVLVCRCRFPGYCRGAHTHARTHAAKDYTGTVNGNDTTNQTVPLGGEQEFECDLVPLGMAAQLDGKWLAYVDNVSATIVSIDISGGRAKILPPTPPGHYDKLGLVELRCEFVTPDGEVLLEFNRTVNVTGELVRLLFGYVQRVLVLVLALAWSCPPCKQF